MKIPKRCLDYTFDIQCLAAADHEAEECDSLVQPMPPSSVQNLRSKTHFFEVVQELRMKRVCSKNKPLWKIYYNFVNICECELLCILCNVLHFLQRVSIACYAERCVSYSKSVRLSVRLSVTRWH